MRKYGWWVAVALVVWSGAAVAEESVSELYRRSYAAEAKGDIGGALAVHEQIGQRGRDYVFELRHGWLLYLAGRFDEASLAYDQACKLQKDAVEPRLGAMLPLMASRSWSKAQAKGLEVISRAGSDFTAQSRLAYVYYVQGQFSESEAWYRKALAGYPANVDARAGLAWSLLKQNKQKDAVAEFNAVLAIAPDHTSAKEGRAALP